METLRIRLLGQVRVTLADGQNVRLPTRKSEALLIYLASPMGVARSRDHLAGLLWGRSGDPHARSSLRQHLSRLRKALGVAGDAVLVEAHAVTLLPEAVDSDVATFESLMAKACRDLVARGG
jgi:DNA-binding SARP family transcriptional activator